MLASLAFAEKSMIDTGSGVTKPVLALAEPNVKKVLGAIAAVVVTLIPPVTFATVDGILAHLLIVVLYCATCTSALVAPVPKLVLPYVVPDVFKKNFD